MPLVLTAFILLADNQQAALIQGAIRQHQTAVNILRMRVMPARIKRLPFRDLDTREPIRGFDLLRNEKLLDQIAEHQRRIQALNAQLERLKEPAADPGAPAGL